MINQVDRWLLPDGIEEILPDQAQQTEVLRRRLVDLFESWGYDYVIPPIVEFKDSLLTGSGRDIDLLTFKLTDQLSGRTLGVRADITPQVARMDAHSLKREGVNRLCYAGHVLHTTPKSPLSSRSPIKAGVEMFGVAELEAEIEVISLLLEALLAVRLTKQYVDLGHVGIFRALAEAAKLDRQQEQTLFALLQSKAVTEIENWVEHNVRDRKAKVWLAALPRLSGNVKVLQEARTHLAGAPSEVNTALDDLQVLADTVNNRYPHVQLYFDLSELRGYHYHTGIVFGAFAPGVGNAIASGGRYDHVGEAFGRARPAAGFDVDLSAICRLLDIETSVCCGIFVASALAHKYWDKIQQLRQQGERVVVGIPGQNAPQCHQKCDRTLAAEDGDFLLIPISGSGE